MSWRLAVASGRKMAPMGRTTVTDHPQGEMLVKFRAFIERITWCCMGIVNIRADTDHQVRLTADAIGSGTACMWNGHHLILTAEHVIRDADPEDLAFLMRVDDAINWEGSGTAEKVVPRVRLPIETIIRDKKNDLAAIVLNSKPLTGYRIEFCELPKQLMRRRTLRRKGSLILHGFPKDRQFAISERKISNVAVNYFAARPIILPATIAAAPAKALSSHYDPDRDVLVDYEPRELGMKPHGFSGAAVWCERLKQSGPIWTTSPMLFGVQTRAYMTAKLLQLVGAPTIRRFLEEAF